MKKLLLIPIFLIHFFLSFSQGSIKGKVIDATSRDIISNVTILVVGTTIGITTDNKGEFFITNVPLGYIKLQASYLGYQSMLSDDYLVTKEKVPFIVFELIEEASQLDEIVVRQKLFKKSVESPLSLQSLGIAEIEKNPGGNRDILKVAQEYPEYQFHKHKGYGTKLHIEMIQKYGYCPIHRRSYKVKALEASLF